MGGALHLAYGYFVRVLTKQHDLKKKTKKTTRAVLYTRYVFGCWVGERVRGLGGWGGWIGWVKTSGWVKKWMGGQMISV